MAEYVIREHHRGRSLADILDDAYITNRSRRSRSSGCSTGPTSSTRSATTSPPQRTHEL